MQRILRALAVFSVVVSPPGCARYRPSPLDPKSELAELRGRDLRHVVVDRNHLALTNAPPTGFRVEDGLDESEMVAVALTLNPSLRVKRAEIGESQAALITAGLWPNPVIGVGVRPGIGGASGTLVEADALFDLLRPGERDARTKAAAATADEVNADAVAQEFKLVGEVRQQRLAALSADRKIALLKEAVDLRQRALEVLKRQRELGEAGSLAVSAIELELAQSHRDLRLAEAELNRECLILNRLLGLPPEYPLKISGLGEPLRVTVFDDVGDDELDARLIAGRWELAATEAAYRKAEQELRLAVWQQYPRLGIGPAFERELDGSKSLGVGLSLELPLLDQGQSRIAQARAARERTHAQYTSLLHQLRAEAFEARMLVRAAKAEVDFQEQQVLPLLQRSQELFENAYRAREISVIDWIAAQQSAVEARQAFLDASVRYRAAVIGFETATGQSLSTMPTISPTTQRE